MINIIIEVLKNASKNSYFCPFCPPWDAQGGHFALLPPPVHAPALCLSVFVFPYYLIMAEPMWLKFLVKMCLNFTHDPYGSDNTALKINDPQKKDKIGKLWIR